jgi:hypothetical protein
MAKTTDGSTYHKRTPLYKRDYIKEFVKNKEINFIFDVGCNNGMISYPLQKELNKKVFGVDLSSDLDIPHDYDFENMDIENTNKIIINDCTLFLSIYHHILGNSGIEKADNVFYKLLLRTKYLIFDTGNISENRRSGTYWYREQIKHFKNEKELFNHFNLKYDTIGSWGTGNGKRNVVIFSKKSFDDSVIVVNEYRRKNGSRNAKYGLTPLNKITNTSGYKMDINFYELELNGKKFFGKKRINNDETEKNEISNIVSVYEHLNPNKTIEFYGYSEKYGLIFEWLENFKYLKKQAQTINDILYTDTDIIEVNGVEKIIDFER